QPRQPRCPTQESIMSEVPTSEAEAEPVNAYSLLTRPTLELSDDEIELIVKDLQKRRLAYVADSRKGADRPDKPKKAPATAEEKKALTAQVAASLKLDFDL